MFNVEDLFRNVDLLISLGFAKDIYSHVKALILRPSNVSPIALAFQINDICTNLDNLAQYNSDTQQSTTVKTVIVNELYRNASYRQYISLIMGRFFQIHTLRELCAIKLRWILSCHLLARVNLLKISDYLKEFIIEPLRRSVNYSCFIHTLHTNILTLIDELDNNFLTTPNQPLKFFYVRQV